MPEHTDKLAEAIGEHDGFGMLVDAIGRFECVCGYVLSYGWRDAKAEHAKHLADIVRGYLRERPVKWAGPSSDSRVRKAATK